MKCWAMGEMFRKAWEYLTGRKLLPCPSLFQWSHLYPTLASHCRDLIRAPSSYQASQSATSTCCLFNSFFLLPQLQYTLGPQQELKSFDHTFHGHSPLSRSHRLSGWCSVIHYCHLSLGYTPLSFSRCVILIWQNPHLVPFSYISLLCVLFPVKLIVAEVVAISAAFPRSKTSCGHFVMPSSLATFS